MSCDQQNPAFQETKGAAGQPRILESPMSAQRGSKLQNDIAGGGRRAPIHRAPYCAVPIKPGSLAVSAVRVYLWAFFLIEQAAKKGRPKVILDPKQEPSKLPKPPK